MNIYQINNNKNRRAESRYVPSGVSVLKTAAGGEDMVILTSEARNSFQRDSYTKNRELELRKLALEHINDCSPIIDALESDAEFITAEKLALLAELVIRVAPSGESRNIYSRVTDFVIEQMTEWQ